MMNLSAVHRTGLQAFASLQTRKNLVQSRQSFETELSQVSAQPAKIAAGSTITSQQSQKIAASQPSVGRPKLPLPISSATIAPVSSTSTQPAAQTGFTALPAIVGSPTVAQSVPQPAEQHWYASDSADDAYWARQPAAVQQLREITDPDQRATLGAQLAGEGYSIDVPIMVWGWDAGKVTQLRQDFGYTWVPSAQQMPLSAAPGITGPGLTPYDPAHPPAGSIRV